MAVSNREMEASTVVKWQKKASQDERTRERRERGKKEMRKKKKQACVLTICLFFD